eukprot:CAMPEP_0115533116 /NCGR_PEP_ID=MMETSP0271-20121206/85945_1 /TAXON_ID=71861 /ORGANISM="Scrippsiella trochoidea, Strain CCMP3099" /LENGTH=101 /DNA_ID=CAMNT_0002965467 /DNA_START=135 /DNA_END=440 /DNA_ORIENTATION=+
MDVSGVRSSDKESSLYLHVGVLIPDNIVNDDEFCLTGNLKRIQSKRRIPRLSREIIRGDPALPDSWEHFQHAIVNQCGGGVQLRRKRPQQNVVLWESLDLR